MAAAGMTAENPTAAPECAHPAAIRGVMAHEFAPYRGAEGPEGTRRTTMYYGPVVGGLPIQAWHCPDCGLLRLSHPDGRREDRALLPGPQPGLLAQPTPVDHPHSLFGRQARVSGLSAEQAFFEEHEPLPTPLLRQLGERLPRLGAVAWITVVGLVALALGLLLAAYLAVYDYQTPGGEAPLLGVLAAAFGALVLLQVAAALGRWWFPPTAPSVAVLHRGRPELNGSTRAAIWLLAITAAGLLVAAYLAVYDYQTSTVEVPVLVGTIACGLGAVAVKLGEAIHRHLNRS